MMIKLTVVDVSKSGDVQSINQSIHHTFNICQMHEQMEQIKLEMRGKA